MAWEGDKVAEIPWFGVSDIRRLCWMFVGPWAALGSHRRKLKAKLCRYVPREFYVYHIKSVLKVVGVPVLYKLFFFLQQSWY